MSAIPYEKLSMAQVKQLIMTDRLPGRKEPANLEDYLAWLQVRVDWLQVRVAPLGPGSSGGGGGDSSSSSFGLASSSSASGSGGGGGSPGPGGQFAEVCEQLQQRRYQEADRARKCQKASRCVARNLIPDRRRLEDIRSHHDDLMSLLARCKDLDCADSGSRLGIGGGGGEGGGGGGGGGGGKEEEEERGGGGGGESVKPLPAAEETKKEKKKEEEEEGGDEEESTAPPLSEVHEWEAKVALVRQKLEARVPVREFRFKPLHRTDKHGERREAEWRDIKSIGERLDSLVLAAKLATTGDGGYRRKTTTMTTTDDNDDNDNDDDDDDNYNANYNNNYMENTPEAAITHCHVEALKVEHRLVQEERYIQNEVDQHARESARCARERAAHLALARRIEPAIRACMVALLRHEMAASRPPPKHWLRCGCGWPGSASAGGGGGDDNAESRGRSVGGGGLDRRWHEVCGEWAAQLERVDETDLRSRSVVFFDDGSAAQVGYAYPTRAAAAEKDDISARADEDERMRCLGEERASSELASPVLFSGGFEWGKETRGREGRAAEECAERHAPVALVSANMGGFFFSPRHFPQTEENPFPSARGQAMMVKAKRPDDTLV